MNIIDRGLSIFNYALAIFMVIVGVATAFQPLLDPTNNLGFLFSHRFAWVTMGGFFCAVGGTLLYGKIRKRKKLVEYALMTIYLSFLFSGVLNGYAFGWAVAAWLPDLIASLVVGADYVHYRFVTAYLDPKTFEADIDGLRDDGPPSRRIDFH